MNKALLKISFYVAILMTLGSIASAQESKDLSDKDFIKTKSKRLADYRKDFHDYANSGKADSEEFDYVLGLLQIALDTNKSLESIDSLLSIHDHMSCKTDKETVRLFIEARVRSDTHALSTDINYIGRFLAGVKNPAILLTGNYLKNDLREIKARLESIKLN